MRKEKIVKGDDHTCTRQHTNIYTPVRAHKISFDDARAHTQDTSRNWKKLIAHIENLDFELMIVIY